LLSYSPANYRLEESLTVSWFEVVDTASLSYITS
jgi:hypothetical protein